MPPRTLSEEEFNAIKQRVLSALPSGLSEEEFKRVAAPAMAQALGEAENTSPEPEGSAVGRFVGGAASVLNPMNVVSAVAHPIQTIQNVGAAAVDQATKAKDAFTQGNYVGAGGHALAAAVPVIGPAAAHAGERIAQGDIAGGLGESVGLVAPFAAQKALEVRSAADPRAADITARAATDQVAQQVLGPGNPRYKGIAQKIAPEVLARKLTGGREDLRQAAVEGMDDAGTRIDAAVQAAGGVKAPIPVGQLVSELQARAADLKDSNGVPLSAQAAKRIDAIQQRVTQIRSLGGRMGAVTYEDLKKLRDENYRIADEARGYEARGNPAMSDDGWAAREVGGAIRKVFAQRSPDAAAANADYAFFKSLNDVLDPALGRPKSTAMPSGVTGGARTVGAVVGQMSKVPGASFVLSTVVPWVKERLASPEWQLASARQKLELADAMRRGDIGRMKAAMSRLGEASALSTSPSGSQTQTTTAASAGLP